MLSLLRLMGRKSPVDSGSGGRVPRVEDEEINLVNDAYQVGLKLIEVDIESSVKPEVEEP